MSSLRCSFLRSHALPLFCTSNSHVYLHSLTSTPLFHVYPPSLYRCNHTISVPCYAKDDLLAWQPWLEQGGKPDGGFISYLDEDNESCMREVVEQSDLRVFGDNGVCRINPLPPTVPRECLYCDGNGVEFKRACGHSRVQRCVDVYFGNCGNCMDSVETLCPEPLCGFVRKRPCHEHEQQLREGRPPICTNIVGKVCNRSPCLTPMYPMYPLCVYPLTYVSYVSSRHLLSIRIHYLMYTSSTHSCLTGLQSMWC